MPGEMGIARLRATEDFLQGTVDITADGCWLWTGTINSTGYAIRNRTRLHRALDEHLNGPIPDGLVVDHQCHIAGQCYLTTDCPHRRCVNPDHLQRITDEQNVARGNWPEKSAEQRRPQTHCSKGHPKDPAKSWCSTCQRERYAARKQAWMEATGRA